MNAKVIFLFLVLLNIFPSNFAEGKILKDMKDESSIEVDKNMRLGWARKQAISKFLLVDMLHQTESHPLYLESSKYSISGDLDEFNRQDSIGIVHCVPKSQNTTYIGIRKDKAYLIIVSYPGEYFSYFDRKDTNWAIGSILEGQLEDLVMHSISQKSVEVVCNKRLSVDWWKQGVNAAFLKKPEQMSMLVAKYLIFLRERDSDPLLKNVECALSNKLYEPLFQLFQALKRRDNNNPKIPNAGLDVFLESMDFLSDEYEMEFYELVFCGKSFCFTLGCRNYNEYSLPFYIDMLCDSLNIYIQYNNEMIKFVSETCILIVIRNVREILKDEPYGNDDF